MSPRKKTAPLTAEEVQGMVQQAIAAAIPQVVAALQAGARPDLPPLDRFERRTLTDSTGATLKMRADGQIEAQRKGAQLWEIMWNQEGVQNLLTVADLAQYPFVNTAGEPCDADGMVKS